MSNTRSQRKFLIKTFYEINFGLESNRTFLAGHPSPGHVKYNTDNDGISLARAALEDDLIERNSSNRFWSFFSKRKKIQGAILKCLSFII